IVLLAVIGIGLEYRRAPLLCWIAGASLIVPWYTVGLFRVVVAYPVRLFVLPMMLLAPFAGAAIARLVRWKPAAAWLGALSVLAQFATDLRVEYPAQPLPMTLLGLRLAKSGAVNRFDTLYVQSAGRWGYPDEIRVATNFRRPVITIPADSPGTPWRNTSAQAILVLNDTQARPADEAFEVARVDRITDWVVCHRPAALDVHVEWVDARVPRETTRDA